MDAQNLKILIIEDDLSFSIELEMMVKEIGYEVLETVDNSAEALECIYSNQPDLILMDVDINGKLSGIEIAEKIQHLEIPVLFITSFKDQNGYDRARNTNFLGYIVKPVEAFSLRSTIELAIRNLDQKKEVIKENSSPLSLRNDLFFKKKGIFKKINIKEICYVEAKGNYTLTATENDNLMTSLNLNELETILKEHDFMRIHRGYIINLRKINYLDTVNNQVTIESKTIPISRAKKAELIKVIRLLQ
ncbi:MAG: LytR/AlgR family response regulator transcription factor [Saprospiraceae bacterium]